MATSLPAVPVNVAISQSPPSICRFHDAPCGVPVKKRPGLWFSPRLHSETPATRRAQLVLATPCRQSLNAALRRSKLPTSPLALAIPMILALDIVPGAGVFGRRKRGRVCSLRFPSSGTADPPVPGVVNWMPQHLRKDCLQCRDNGAQPFVAGAHRSRGPWTVRVSQNVSVHNSFRRGSRRHGSTTVNPCSHPSCTLRLPSCCGAERLASSKHGPDNPCILVGGRHRCAVGPAPTKAFTSSF